MDSLEQLKRADGDWDWEEMGAGAIDVSTHTVKVMVWYQTRRGELIYRPLSVRR